jgi:hypothetical protein
MILVIVGNAIGIYDYVELVPYSIQNTQESLSVIITLKDRSTRTSSLMNVVNTVVILVTGLSWHLFRPPEAIIHQGGMLCQVPSLKFLISALGKIKACTSILKYVHSMMLVQAL